MNTREETLCKAVALKEFSERDVLFTFSSTAKQ